MDSTDGTDDIAEGLLRVAAQLQSFAASVLGLELDYVTPDLQSFSGWVGAAKAPGKHPVILQFRTPNGISDAATTTQARPAQAASTNSADVSLSQYLDEIPDEILDPGSPAAAAARAAAGVAGLPGCSSARPLSTAAMAQPDHPNLAIVIEAMQSPSLLLSSSSPTTPPNPATAPSPSPPPTTPPFAVQPPHSSLATTWHPGCSLADCLRHPAAAAICGLYGSASGIGTCGNGAAGGDQPLRILLLQVVAAVCHVHSHGRALGGLSPATVLLQPGGWVQLLPPPPPSPWSPTRSGSARSGSELDREQDLGQQRHPQHHDSCSHVQPPSPPLPHHQDQPHQQQGLPHSAPVPAATATPSLPLQHAPAPPAAVALLPRLPACLRPAPPTLPALTRAWQQHQLTSLDYLMLLNLLAGRRLGDRTMHPFVPWVTDFTVHPASMLGLAAAATPPQQPRTSSVDGIHSTAAGGARDGCFVATVDGRNRTLYGSRSSGGGGGGGVSSGGGSSSSRVTAVHSGWHDLTQSRYRQAKGDLQLDVTYSSSEVPHHIPQEPLSELSYCHYMARVTPRAVLQRAVRAHFEPREYPPSLVAMLAQSPDECLPQLYTDPGVFSSVHPELPDLQLPEWAASPQDFIAWHRALLESDHVSIQLPAWIDLMFGCQLVGPAAVAAKNVYLPQPRHPAAAAAGTSLYGSGIGDATAGGFGGSGGGVLAHTATRHAAAAAAAAAGAGGMSYAPTGMHAPLFLTPHPPRRPRPAAAAAGAAGAGDGAVSRRWLPLSATPLVAGGAAVSAAHPSLLHQPPPPPHHPVPQQQQQPAEPLQPQHPALAASLLSYTPLSTGVSGGGRGISSSGGASASASGTAPTSSVLSQLDSLELLAAAAGREGGLTLHLNYFSIPPADSYGYGGSSGGVGGSGGGGRGRNGGSGGDMARPRQPPLPSVAPQRRQRRWRDGVQLWRRRAPLPVRSQPQPQTQQQPLQPLVRQPPETQQQQQQAKPSRQLMPASGLPSGSSRHWAARGSYGTAAEAPGSGVWADSAAAVLQPPHGTAQQGWASRGGGAVRQPVPTGGSRTMGPGDAAGSVTAAAAAAAETVAVAQSGLAFGKAWQAEAGAAAEEEEDVEEEEFWELSGRPWGEEWEAVGGEEAAAEWGMQDAEWGLVGSHTPARTRRCGEYEEPGSAAASGTGVAAGTVEGAMQTDCQAIGQVAVQLYLGRTCTGPPQHSAYWLQLASRLPAAARRFVRRCFDPQASAERLLSDSFFGAQLHAAHAFLRTTLYDRDALRQQRHVQSPASDGQATTGPAMMQQLQLLMPPPRLLLPQQLSALAAAASYGRLDELAEQRPAPELCMPHIMHVLWQAAFACGVDPSGGSSGGCSGGGGSSGVGVNTAAAASSTTTAAAAMTQMSGHVYDIVQALLRVLTPDQVTAHLLPYVCGCLSYFLEDNAREEGSSSGYRAELQSPRTAAVASTTGAGRSGGGGGGGGSRSCGRCLALQHRLLSATLHSQLLQGSDLDTYIQLALPPLLAALLCTEEGLTSPQAPSGAAAAAGADGSGAAVGGVARALAVASVSDAAAAALVALASRLPLPLLLERVVSPLLSSLTAGTSIPRLLVQICAELGGQLTARHVAPALLQLAVVPAPPPLAAEPTLASSAARASASASRGGKGGLVAAGARLVSGGGSGSARGVGEDRYGSGSGSSSAAAAAAAAPPVDVRLQQEIYTALSVLTSLLDLLPRDFIPRVFLQGIPPLPAPPSPTPHVSPSTPPLTPSAGGDSTAAATTPMPYPSPRSGTASAGAAAAGNTGVPPLLTCLLDPGAFCVAPGTLTMLAELVLRAYVRWAKPENLAWVVLPHLMPLLKHGAPRRRAAYRANGTIRRADVTPSYDQGRRSATVTAQFGSSIGAGGAVVISGAAGVGDVSSGGGGGDRGYRRSLSSPCGGSDGGGSGGANSSDGRAVEGHAGRVVQAERAGEGDGEEALGDPEGGYWELVQCVYGQLVEHSGLLTVRNLLPGWQVVESGLASRLGWSPVAAAVAAAAAAGASSLGGGGAVSREADDVAAAADALAAAAPPPAATAAAVGTGVGVANGGGVSGSGQGGRSQASLEKLVRQEIASKQQRVAALYGTQLFIKEVGWSAPTSRAGRTSSSPRDVLPSGAGGRGGAYATAAPGAISAGGGGGGFGVFGARAAAARGSQRNSSVAAAMFDWIDADDDWPQMLAIGSPTVVEGLRGGGGGGGGGGGLSRQASGGGSISRQSSGGGAAPGAAVAAATGSKLGASTAPADVSNLRTSQASVRSDADGVAASLLRQDSTASVADGAAPSGSGGGGGPHYFDSTASAAAAGLAAALAASGGAAASGSSGRLPLFPVRSDPPPSYTSSHSRSFTSATASGLRAMPVNAGSGGSSAGASAKQQQPSASVTAPSSPFPTSSALPSLTSAASSALPRRTGAAAAPPLSPLLIPPPTPPPEPATPDTGSQRWSWLPPAHVDLATATPQAALTVVAAAPFGGGTHTHRAAKSRLLAAAASAPQTSDVWSLQATVIHSWPAHRDRIRTLAVHPGECAVLTAGRGAVAGREGPVVRVWSLSDCQARVQYGGHKAAVQGLLLLRAARAGGAVVASLDASGQLHVWSYDSGQQLACFKSAAAAAAAGPGGGGSVGGSGVGSAVGDSHLSSSDAEPHGANWTELIERSGHYSHNQPAGTTGWPSMGGLKTSRQLAAAATSAAAAVGSTITTTAAPPSSAAAGRAAASGLGAPVSLLSAAAAAAAGSSAPGASGAGAAASGGLRLGYTAMCTAPDEHRILYAGTADARVCVLDMERCRVVSEWLAAPAVRHDGDDVITSLCTPGGGGGGGGEAGGWSVATPPWLAPEVVAAGSRSGRIMVLDRRCGTAVMSYKAHGGEVSSMASYGSFSLVTAGADKLLRLWDLRRCAGSGSGGGGGGSGMSTSTAGAFGVGYDSRTGPWSGWEGPRGGIGAGGEPLWGLIDAMSPAAVGAALQGGDGMYGNGGPEIVMPPPPPPVVQLYGSGGATSPALVRSYSLPREGVQNLRVLRDCVIMTSGSSVGVLALQPTIAAVTSTDSAAAFTNASGSSGSSSSGGSVGGPSFARLRNSRGGRESAGITGLAVLPCCRLLVVAGEDGAVRICR